MFLIDGESLHKRGVASLKISVKMGVEPNRDQKVLILMHNIYKTPTLRTKYLSKKVIKGTAV